MIKLQESRLEIALKVFQWNPEVADLSRVAEELNVSSYSFNTMTDEQFFQELFMYVNERSTIEVS